MTHYSIRKSAPTHHLPARFLRAEHLIGALVALFLLSGRWSPVRLLDHARESPVFEVRFWIGFVLLLLLVVPVRRASKHGPARVGTNALILSMILFFGYSMFSIGWAPDLDLAVQKTYELGLLSIGCLALHRWLQTGNAERICISFWSSGLLLTLFLAMLAVLSTLPASRTVRLSVLAGGPNTFGRMMGLFFLGNLFMWRRTGRSWVFAPPAVVAVYLVILSGSRSAFLALILAVAFVFATERIQLTKMLKFIVVSVVASVVLFWYTPVGQTAARTFQYRVIGLSLEERYMSGRDNLFLDALELGMNNLVFGAGLAGFPARELGVYPHNMFLEAFSEGGLVGLTSLLIVIACFLVLAWRRRGRLDKVTLGAAGLVFTFSQFSGDYYDNRMVFILMLLALVPRSTIPSPLAAGGSPVPTIALQPVLRFRSRESGTWPKSARPKEI